MVKNKCHLKKDDKVKIVAGKDKGKTGSGFTVQRLIGQRIKNKGYR